MIKGTIQEEDITIINIYAPNIGAPQYVREMITSMKGEINNNTIIVGDFNTPLTPMDRSTKQKINKETQTLNDTLLSVSYHFAFSYFSWRSQGKNTEVVCHSLLQWTTFCQTSPP